MLENCVHVTWQVKLTETPPWNVAWKFFGFFFASPKQIDYLLWYAYIYSITVIWICENTGNFDFWVMPV